MAEYIKTEHLLDCLDDHSCLTKKQLSVIIDALPASDVEPVRHGRCKFCEDGKSFMGTTRILWQKIKFCPNCGEKMDLVE